MRFFNGNEWECFFLMGFSGIRIGIPDLIGGSFVDFPLKKDELP
jgi:hypothetical protein